MVDDMLQQGGDSLLSLGKVRGFIYDKDNPLVLSKPADFGKRIIKGLVFREGGRFRLLE